GVVLTGILQAHERFAGPALAPLLSSVVVIAAYLLYWANSGAAAQVADLGRGAELLLSVGTTLGVVVLSLLLLIPLRRAGVSLRRGYGCPRGGAGGGLSGAGGGGGPLGAQQLSVGVALRLANQNTADGTVVVYTLAQTVFLLPWATLAVPLATSAFPRLSASM